MFTRLSLSPLLAAAVVCFTSMAGGCQTAPTSETEIDSSTRTAQIWDVVLPTAPWDSFLVRYDSTTLDAVPETLRVEGPDGWLEDFAAVQLDASTIEFVPREELVPGRYVVVEALGSELDPQPESQVLPWGTAFELPQPGEAILLDIDGVELVNPPGIEGLIGSVLGGDMVVEFLEQTDDTDDRLPFRVVLAQGDGACVVHESAALATSTGTLTDIHAVLDYDAGAALGQLYGVQLELAFWEDRVRTRRASAVADTAALGPLFSGPDDSDGLCDLAGAFGVECGPCPITDTDTCMDIEVRSLEGERVPLPWSPGAAIAECNAPGQPIGIDIDPIECGCDGSGGLGVLWLGLFALPLVRRR